MQHGIQHTSAAGCRTTKRIQTARGLTCLLHTARRASMLQRYIADLYTNCMRYDMFSDGPADATARRAQTQTMHTAIRAGDVVLLYRCLVLGADANQLVPCKESGRMLGALHLACGMHTLQAVEMLLMYNAAVDLGDADGWTAVRSLAPSGERYRWGRPH